MPLIRRDPTAARPPSTTESPDAATAATALRTGLPQERWAAARALAASPASVPALGQALDTEADERVREAIFTSLVRINTAESVETLFGCLRGDDAARRNAALDALKTMSGQVQARLEALLHDADTDVRILACDLARDLPSDGTAALLANLLETDPAVNVCVAAIETLAEIGSTDVLPALARCADRFPDQAFLRFAVTAASGRIGATSFRQAPPLGHDG
jgi:HEAT repeat protein